MGQEKPPDIVLKGFYWPNILKAVDALVYCKHKQGMLDSDAYYDKKGVKEGQPGVLCLLVWLMMLFSSYVWIFKSHVKT